MGAITQEELRQRLERVAQHESDRRKTLLHRLLLLVGPTRLFASVYRRLGPRIDPWLLRKSAGRIATRLYGFPALLLLSTGAKSGQPRTSPLVYVRDGEDFLVVGTNFGTGKNPAWTGNLLKNPAAAVMVGGETVPVTAELLDSEGFAQHWPKFPAVYPGYNAYRVRWAEQQPRMFRLRPALR